MRLLRAALLLLPLALLCAATAVDLEGHWVVDSEATWALLQEDPQVKAQFAHLPPAQQEAIRQMVMGKMARVHWAIVAGQATITDPEGVVRTSTWTVTANADDTLSISATDGERIATEATITVAGDHLIARGFATSPPTPGQPGASLVMKRGDAAPTGK